jgi:hypothetical protein
MSQELLSKAHEAIQVLFRGTDPQAQHDANRWLMEFCAEPAAWGIADQLLNAESPEVQYYGANILFTKGQNDWATLSEQQREQLRHNLLEHLKSKTRVGASPVSLRLAHSLASMAIRTPRGSTSLLEQILSLGSDSVDVALEVLCVLPEQVPRADLTFTQREQLEAELKAEVPRILEAFNTMLASACAPGNPNFARAEKIMEGLTSWQYVGISLAQLHAGGTLQASLQALQALPRLLPKVCFMLAEALHFKTGNKTAEHGEAANMLALALSSLRVVFEQGADVETCRAVGQLSSTFCEIEVKFIVEGSPVALELIQLQLLCVAHDDKGIAEETLEFFSAVNDLPFDKRCEACRQPLYRQLLQILVSAAMLAPSFRGWDQSAPGFYFEMEEEQFRNFRDNVSDALVTCFFVLQQEYMELAAGAIGQAAWQVREALLFTINAVAGEIRDMLREGDAGTKAHAQAFFVFAISR